MTLIVILTPIIVLLFYNSCNRLSQATWHIVYCISHTKPDSFSTLFQSFDSFVCNNRCLLILPHASLIPHYRRQFFSPQLKSGRCWLSFGFQGLPFQFQPSPACFPPSHPSSGARYRRGAATGESKRAIWSNWQVPGRCLQLCWHFPASPLSIYGTSSSYKPKAELLGGIRGPHFHSFIQDIYLQIFVTAFSTICVLKITFPLI